MDSAIIDRQPAFETLDMGGKQLRRNVSQSWRDPAAPPPSAGAAGIHVAPGTPEQQKVVVAYQRMMPRKVLRASSKLGRSRSSAGL